MNELERKVVFNESLFEKSKMFRNLSITCIEDFPNEIFYEIFDYLDGGEIVGTFSHLNSQFEQLLHSSLLLNKTHFYLFHHQEMITAFNELEIFPTKTCSNLKILFISSSRNIAFLDAHRWERLILHCYPQLEIFYLNYYDRMNTDNQYEIYSGQISQFSSSFWIERKWIFDVRIAGTEIEYMIYPKRKPWYDYFEEKNIEYSTSSLILTNFLIFEYDKIIFEEIKRVLTITHIYHLNIPAKHLPISTLIRLINYLPDITTLRFESLSFGDLETITTDDLFMVCAFPVESKITKVYLGEIGDVQELGFLFLLCPNMEYFKLGRIDTMDVQSFLHIFFERTKYNKNDHPRSFCFHIPKADDQIGENIYETIKCEELLSHFTVKRIMNTFYLQRK